MKLFVSFLQILSVLSFFTSVLALVRVGSVSFHRLSHKFEAQPQQMGVASDAKAPLWNWSGSFSLGSLIGEDEEEELRRKPGRARVGVLANVQGVKASDDGIRVCLPEG